MQKMIPYEKLSKKEKRKVNAQKRTLWQCDPVTRCTKNRKVYDRKRAEKAVLPPIGSFCFAFLR